MNKKSLNLKPTLKTLTFQLNFLLKIYLLDKYNGFSNIESREISLNGNVYDFSVDYSSINISDILNIHNYLMTKNNIK